MKVDEWLVKESDCDVNEWKKVDVDGEGGREEGWEGVK
jgi:hypothetical protein